VSLRTLVLIMLLSPRQSEGNHAPDILRSMTTDRILAAIDEEFARLKKVRDLLSTSTAAAKDNTASPVRKRRKLSAAARKRIYVYAFSPPTCESQYVVGSVKNSPCLQRERIASSLTLMPRPDPVGTGM